MGGPEGWSTAPEPEVPHEPLSDVTERTLNLRGEASGAQGLGAWAVFWKVGCGRQADCCVAQGESWPVGFSLLGGKGKASSRCSLSSFPILALWKTGPFWLFFSL